LPIDDGQVTIEKEVAVGIQLSASGQQFPVLLLLTADG
jgi:hypothetical protein